MATTERNNGEEEVELIVRNASGSSAIGGGGGDYDEINPMVSPPGKPRVNIFSISYSRRKPREHTNEVSEIEILPLTQFISWVWAGSRYSGLLCMALSSVIYFLMELVSDIFSAQSIPLYETSFVRCTVILILSCLWLRRTGQPIFGPTQARMLLVSRAVMGCLSLMSFIYCVQRLPLSQAIVLNFTTPIMASIAARIILHENLKISDIGGLACSFFGVLIIFRLMLYTQEDLVRAGNASNISVRGNHHVYTVLAGLFSSITGGISYCLIKAGAKASDQPVATVFSFGMLASVAAGVCMVSLDEFVLPGFYSFSFLIVLGLLAFSAEVLLARGLQLEKTCKAANVMYIEVALSQLWGTGSATFSPSYGRLAGCLLILISFCSTMYIGPDKTIE